MERENFTLVSNDILFSDIVRELGTYELKMIIDGFWKGGIILNRFA